MLDAGYKPLYIYAKEFENAVKDCGIPVKIGVEREKGHTAVKTIHIYKDGHEDDNFFYVERTVKTMLYAYGGSKIYIDAPDYIVEKLAKTYSKDGKRAFDVDFIETVYLMPIEVHKKPAEQIIEVEDDKSLSGGFKGRRIGFDAGGSDRKVTASVDGEIVFDDETVWFPKLNADPEYHIAGIKDSIDRALEKLDGKVDAIGVSTAGVVVDDEVRLASLFRKVPKEIYKEKIAPIYKNLSSTYGVPVKVANDGDVSALAGAVSLKKGRLLGIAMGTSLAAGYIDKNLNIKGYINELAFAPVDANKNAEKDEWSGDTGVGTSYMSQDAVIKLCKDAKIELDDSLAPAEKLKVAQKLVNEGDKRAEELFERMGEYFGYSIMYFSMFYDIETVMFLGRVASGKGGDIILKVASDIVKKESQGAISIVIPDERTRRLGQSYVACSLV